jgi:hypothetical protein
LLALSCAERRSAEVVSAGRDWAKVLTVDPAEGIYFDLQSGRPFKHREFIHDSRREFSEGLCSVEQRLENKKQFEEGKEGYIDRAGRLVIPFQYDYASGFCDGRACVAVGKARGIIDKSGRWVVELGSKYDSLGAFSEGRCAFRKGERWGFFDTDGNVAIPPVYKKISFGATLRFKEGLCPVEDESGQKVYIDRDGHVRIRLPGVWEAACSFSEGLARVQLMIITDPKNDVGWDKLTYGAREGYVSKDGRMVIEPRFGTAGDFSEGLAPVTITNDGAVSANGDELLERWSPNPEFPEPPPAWGFINKKGEVVIPMIYEKALGFREGLAPVRQNGRWGYIDHQGCMVIGAVFVYASQFRNGVAEVVIAAGSQDAMEFRAEVMDTYLAYIDKHGRLLVRTAMSGARF